MHPFNHLNPLLTRNCHSSLPGLCVTQRSHFRWHLDTLCAMTNKILSVVHTSIAGFSYQTAPTALM